MVYDQVKRGIK